MRHLLVSSFACSLLLLACGNADPEGEGSGGAHQGGTSTGSSGANGTGGLGTGGATMGGAGGAGGTAGNVSSGGTGGTGGTTQNGGNGNAGTGGSAGQSSGGTTSNGGADDGYNPCPPEGTPCAIMPFGDSLTFGDHGNNTNDGSYRPRLFHLALEAGHSITFVGQGMNGPDMVDGVTFPKNHDGYPGYSIDGGGAFPGITSFAAEHIGTYQPHIVTLMIGTNDTASEIDLDNAPTRLGNLLDIILDADPNLLLVVAQISPTKYDDAFDARIEAYNAAIPALVTERANAGKHVLMVDMYSAFINHPNYKDEYFGDVVHCSNAGYDAMGDVWYEAIGDRFR